MQENNIDIQPALRLQGVQEYYFSRKGKEVARMNAEGKDVISLAIGSPDMPPSDETVPVGKCLIDCTDKICRRFHLHM